LEWQIILCYQPFALSFDHLWGETSKNKALVYEGEFLKITFSNLKILNRIVSF